MLAMVSVPAGVTLMTVRSPGRLQMVGSNPTPHGYTWSLLLFLVPIMVIALAIDPDALLRADRNSYGSISSS
jgi:hypothetical protein